MQAVPSYGSVTLGGRRILADLIDLLEGPDVVVQNDQLDSGNTPTFRLREGYVVAKRTSSGEFVKATDANADVGTPAAITSSGQTDGNGVIKLVGHFGTISVTTTTGAGTEANNATDLNADAAFKAHLIATSGGGELTITSRLVGSGAWFYVHSDTMNTSGLAEGVANGVYGADPEIYVIRQQGDTSIDGTATSPVLPTFARGHFVASNLLGLTAEARATLIKRGCTFE